MVKEAQVDLEDQVDPEDPKPQEDSVALVEVVTIHQAAQVQMLDPTDIHQADLAALHFRRVVQMDLEVAQL